MQLLLAGDIGGTKTILRLVRAEEGGESGNPTLQICREATYESQAFPDLVPMVHQFLEAEEREPGAIAAASFAIAGPVVDNACRLTNLDWYLEGDRLERELGIAHVTLVNDFAAIGYGVLSLPPEDLHVLQAAEPQLDAPVAIIGAGTGLGEAFLLRGKSVPRVFATEGGHTNFAARSELEFQLGEYIQQKFNISRVSVERVVSGQGIVAIYEFFLSRADEAIKNSNRATAVLEAKDPGAAISMLAFDPELSDADPAKQLAREALELFASAYGAEAGDFALKLLPFGGMFIAGGIAAKILPVLQEGDRFLKAFSHKGRVSPLLQQVPIYVVLNPKVGLLGAATLAASTLGV